MIRNQKSETYSAHICAAAPLRQVLHFLTPPPRRRGGGSEMGNSCWSSASEENVWFSHQGSTVTFQTTDYQQIRSITQTKHLDRPLVAACSVGHKTHTSSVLYIYDPYLFNPDDWKAQCVRFRWKDLLAEMFYKIIESDVFTCVFHLDCTNCCFLYRRMSHLYLNTLYTHNRSGSPARRQPCFFFYSSPD